MTWQRRTDLASEAKEIWQQSSGETTQLSGVKAYDKTLHGFPLSAVEILDTQGEQALGKPKGKYITLEIDALLRREKDGFARAVQALSETLLSVLDIKDAQNVLVVGLGNPDITPDAVGPIVTRYTMATTHLLQKMPEEFQNFRPVSVLQAGVLGMTGVESAHMVQAFVAQFKPDAVVAVDALASRKFSRVCRTVQVSNTGIVPGSGIGNARAALNEETLGVPVVALGVPTVVDAGTLAADILEETGGDATFAEKFQEFGKNMIVTPKEIDRQVADISKLMAYAINMALHKDLSVADIDMFVG